MVAKKSQLEFVIREPWMSVPDVEPISPVEVEIFHTVSEDFDLPEALDLKSELPK